MKRILLALLFTLFLAACASPQTPASTPPPTATIAPSSTVKPEPTATATPQPTPTITPSPTEEIPEGAVSVEQVGETKVAYDENGVIVAVKEAGEWVMLVNGITLVEDQFVKWNGTQLVEVDFGAGAVLEQTGDTWQVRWSVGGAEVVAQVVEGAEGWELAFTPTSIVSRDTSLDGTVNWALGGIQVDVANGQILFMRGEYVNAKLDAETRVWTQDLYTRSELGIPAKGLVDENGNEIKAGIEVGSIWSSEPKFVDVWETYRLAGYIVGEPARVELGDPSALYSIAVEVGDSELFVEINLTQNLQLNVIYFYHDGIFRKDQIQGWDETSCRDCRLVEFGQEYTDLLKPGEMVVVDIRLMDAEAYLGYVDPNTGGMPNVAFFKNWARQQNVEGWENCKDVKSCKDIFWAFFARSNRDLRIAIPMLQRIGLGELPAEEVPPACAEFIGVSEGLGE